MSISQFLTDVEGIIISLTPNYLSGISFKKAPDNMALEVMEDSAEATDRSFQIRFGSVSDVSQFNCDGFSIKSEMLVLMRYFISHKDDNKYIEANIMSAEDARQIVAAVLHPTQNYNNTFYGVTFDEDSGLLETDNESIFFRQLKFTVDSADSLGVVAVQAIEPEYSTFDEVYAYLEAQGATFKKSIPLYKMGFEGDNTKIIGSWGYNSLGYIVPTTEIDFSLVTDGGFGIVSAVVDGRKLTLTNGHTVPCRKPYNVRVVQFSTGDEIYNGTATCMGNTLTLTSTTGIAETDLVYVDGRSEFTIGNNTRNIQLQTGAIVMFNNGVMKVGGNGQGLAIFNNIWSKNPKLWNFECTCTMTNDNPTNGSFAGSGVLGRASGSSTDPYVLISGRGTKANISQNLACQGNILSGISTLGFTNATNYAGGSPLTALSVQAHSWAAANGVYISFTMWGVQNEFQNIFGSVYTGGVASCVGITSILTNKVCFYIRPGDTEEVWLNITKLKVSQ